MGASDEVDERVFATLIEVTRHDGHQWWLSTSKCSACGTDWMIAQDERIHDNYYLKRLSPEAAETIVNSGIWPSEFLTYEQVLRLGVASGKTCSFYDRRDPALVATASDLLLERPDMSAAEMAHLLAISSEEAAVLRNL
jgi:hypothetical protein